MSKLKNKNQHKSHLTAEQKKIGKEHIYILIAMIMIGLVAGLYYMK